MHWKQVGGWWSAPSARPRLIEIEQRHVVVKIIPGPLPPEVRPADILRHTAASYLIAHHQDAGKVALWLGNSAPILMRHYLEIVSKAAAGEWSRIRTH